MANSALRVPVLLAKHASPIGEIPGSSSPLELYHLLRDARRFFHERFEQLLLFWAGYDTTASAGSWIFSCG